MLCCGLQLQKRAPLAVWQKAVHELQPRPWQPGTGSLQNSLSHVSVIKFCWNGPNE
mgnify:CR=1